MDYNEYGYELDEEELAPTKPYSPERRAEIDELNAEIANLFREIQG